MKVKLKFRDNFLGYFKFYYSVIGKRIWLYLFLSVLVSLLDGLGLTMFIPLLQSVQGGDAVDVGQDSMGALHHATDFVQRFGIEITLYSVLALLVTLFVLKGIFRYIQFKFQAYLRYHFIKRVRYVLVNNLSGLSYQGFLTLDAGRIQNTLIAEVQRLFQTMNSYFQAAQFSAMVATYIFLAFLANWQFAILVSVGGALSNYIYRRIYVATKRASIAVSKKGHDFNSFLIQAILYFKYLKSTDYFSKFSIKLKGVIDETETLNKRMGGYTAIITGIREPIIVFIVVIVIVLQLRWLGGEMATIILSLLLFYRGLSFMMAVQQNWQNFIQNVGSMDAVSSMLQEMDSWQEPDKGLKFEDLERGLALNNVTYSYGHKRVIDVDGIEIKKLSSIALVGESGSGKTTLVNIIAGLIQPNTGQILVDGKPLDAYSLVSYRSKIGYISQEPVIFNDTIFNNISFWAEPNERNLDRFRKAVEMASLTQFIESQPNREHTILGDNGVMISGGQRQRISIARELYKDVSILILDEATSALDSETEKVIKENLERLRGDYTMIIIAHRLSTIKNTDVIYLLDQGKIAASGKFEAMVDISPKFKRMVELQEV